MKVLITGSNGLLGQKLVKRCLKHNISFIATSKGKNRNPGCPEENYIPMELEDHSAIIELITETHPDAIIHTAAITNVDYCEDNKEECHRVNVESVRTLFEISRKQNIHFQLLSTDFVFNGEKGNYSEIDKVEPLSVYAKSKVDAENILLNSDYDNWSIARTIIVYGTGANLSRSNMILWALSALPQNQPMNLVNDQFRAPTWADDLAYGCMEIVLRKEQGIFHLGGPETLAVSEIVRRIARHIGANENLINEISSSTLNQAAKRPPRTGFNLSKAQSRLNYHPKPLEETIDLLLKELKEQG
jgi:dTDP-4-dehydrorhamnose reductase